MANGTGGTKGGGAENTTQASAPVNNLAPLGEMEKVGGLSEKKEWVKNNTNVSPEKLEATMDAMDDFTGGYSTEIRYAQKKGEAGTIYGEKGAVLEDYIKEAPQWDNSRDLHRGMTLSPNIIKEMINTQGTNKTIDINNSGTASWSTKYARSENFCHAIGDDVPVMFRTKSMKNATPVMHLSNFYSEMEVISSKDNRFKIKKVSKKKINGKEGYLIDVEQA